MTTDQQPSSGPRSDDGKWWWDGHQWYPLTSSQISTIDAENVGSQVSYAPIRKVLAPPASGRIRPAAAPEPGTAVVIHRRGQPLQVLWPPMVEPTSATAAALPGAVRTDASDLLARLAVMLKPIQHLYLVDISDHQMETCADLPCSGEAFHFTARLHFTCTVVRPEVVVARGLEDVGATLRPLLMDAMRIVSRQYGVEDSAKAESAITTRLRTLEQADGFHLGLRLSNLVVKLGLDTTTQEYVRERKRLEQNRELVRLQGEVDGLKARVALDRSEMYRNVFESGDLLHLYLSQHPEQLAGVIQVMTKKQEWGFDSALKAYHFLIENDIVEKAQFDDVGEQVGRNFLDQLRTTRLPSSGVPPAPALEEKSRVEEAPQPVDE